MRLQKVKNDFFRDTNDLQQQTQGKKTPSPVKNISQDYQPTAMNVAVPDALAAEAAPARGVYTCPHLPSCYSPTAERPPDQATA
jgi:hypothetical protein